jgi:hypothetical protein
MGDLFGFYFDSTGTKKTDEFVKVADVSVHRINRKGFLNPEKCCIAFCIP